MMKIQRDVEAFHKKFGAVVGDRPKIRRSKLRRRLIAEESKELCKALKKDDMEQAIDGMCDLMYVTLGTAVEMGIDLQPFWDAVHKANMAKDGGGERADGKIKKPEGWEPANIGELLKHQRNLVPA